MTYVTNELRAAREALAASEEAGANSQELRELRKAVYALVRVADVTAAPRRPSPRAQDAEQLVRLRQTIRALEDELVLARTTARSDFDALQDELADKAAALAQVGNAGARLWAVVRQIAARSNDPRGYEAAQALLAWDRATRAS